MAGTRPRALHPTLPMLAESLTLSGWECHMELSDPQQSYRGIRLYHRQQILQKDVLYLLRPTETEFPFDDYPYLCSVPLPGKANHLVCPDRPDEVILDQLLEIFAGFDAWEESMDLLLYRGASLQELCELGATLLENPVCIHDDWFVMAAMTPDFAQILEPEYLMTSTKGFIPRSVVEDFLYDSDYLETYAHHEAKIWSAPDHPSTLYVNLWDGSIYKGRLLVAKKNREFLHRDFMLAEALTQRAVMLLRRKQPGEEAIHQNMDDILFSLLQSRQTEPAALLYLAERLRWQMTDRFICLRLKPQQNISAMMNQVLHSDLFQHFPHSYILMSPQEQCVIFNITQSPITPGQIRQQLASVCRDYCLYAGISFPAEGISELNVAYHQAGFAIEQVFRLRGGVWILCFQDCVLDCLTGSLPAPLMPHHLVCPELTALKAYDQENGTLYFETLRQYLLLERDIPKTSEKLIIHRTTLLYRLKKIQSLVNLNLEDPWLRLYLTLSLWILEKEE